MAANCARSLLLPQSPTAADQSIARYLIPRLIAFATNTDPEDPESARSLVAQALTAYVATVPAERAPFAMALVLPTLLARAAGERKNSDGSGESNVAEVYRETSVRLLELASAHQGAFRGVVGGMGEAQRAFLEEVIRAGRQAEAASGAKVARGVPERPTIALKMDFGG